MQAPRGTPTFPSPFRDVDSAALQDRFEPIEASAGSIILTDPRLAHASTDNRGERERITAICTFVLRDEPLVHQYRWPDGTVERFQVEPDFYTRFDLHRAPTGGRSLGRAAIDFPALENDDVLRRYPPRARTAS